MKKIFYILVLILTLTWSCKNDSNDPPSNQSTENNCSNLGTLQDTIVDGGTKYFIIASSGVNSDLCIELIYSGTCASNLTINFLQAINGNNCFESSNVTTLLPPTNKAYSFGSFPSWAIDTTTVCVMKMTINSTIYYLRDNKLNK